MPEERPSRTQWTPFYGPRLARRAEREGRPSILDDNYQFHDSAALFHTFSYLLPGFFIADHLSRWVFSNLSEYIIKNL